MISIRKFRLFPVPIFVVFFAVNFIYAQPGSGSTSRSDFVGSVKNGVYRNSFLGFEMKVPASWIQLSKSEENTAKSFGSEGFKSQTGSNAREIDSAIGAETIVLSFAKKSLGSAANSGFAVGIGRQPNNRVTPAMVAEGAKELFLASSDNQLIQDVKVERIAGRTFASLIIEMIIYGQRIRVKYYAMMVRNYSVTFSISGADGEALEEIEASLQSVRFGVAK